jgi:protein TonB
MSAVAIDNGRSVLALARERLRENLGRRAVGIAVALAVEALLLWALISLGEIELPHKIVPLALDSFDVRNEVHPAAEHQKKPSDQALARAAPNLQTPQPTQAPKPLAPAPQPATVVPLLPQAQSFDLGKIAKAPASPSRAGPMIGPMDTPHFGDSERVGSAPNGQPMYAARWYREPTDQELRGYLSTAQGPAWGLITCKTVADFRVEDCVGLDEYPEGSRMLPAILAAAWQFRVRPPQVGGVSQVGDWVRIRIDYELRPAGGTYGRSR